MAQTLPSSQVILIQSPFNSNGDAFLKMFLEMQKKPVWNIQTVPNPPIGERWHDEESTHG